MLVVPGRLADAQMQTFDHLWQCVVLPLATLAPGCLGENNEP
jgi:hypothetical protein